MIEGVQRGAIPLTTALEIARAKDGDENLGDMPQEAYENGQLKGRQIIEAKRLIEKRQEHGPSEVVMYLKHWRIRPPVVYAKRWFLTSDFDFRTAVFWNF